MAVRIRLFLARERGLQPAVRALKRIDEALARKQEGELRVESLLSKSAIFQILADSGGSATTLSEAAPLIDPDREPRNAFGLRFNL